MKKYFVLYIFLLCSLMVACSSKKAYHETSMPAPESYQGHFGDMDTDGNEIVDWDEFKTHFPHAEPKVFKAIDLNEDDQLDHDEWHEFKKAHGMKHHN